MKKQKPRLIVGVLVKKDNKYLLVKEKVEDGKEYWLVPGGGVEGTHFRRLINSSG